jgi:hypothetical protein
MLYSYCNIYIADLTKEANKMETTGLNALEELAESAPENMQQEPYLPRAEVEPDKWYGTCYGRDLDLEQGWYSA